MAAAIPASAKEPFKQLCACTLVDDIEACESNWLRNRKEPAVYTFVILIFVQLILGWISWAILKDPDEVKRLHKVHAKRPLYGLKNLATMKLSDKWMLLSNILRPRDPQDNMLRQTMLITNSIYFEIASLSTVCPTNLETLAVSS